MPLRRLFILLAFLGGGVGLVGVRQRREARREETGLKQNSDGVTVVPLSRAVLM